MNRIFTLINTSPILSTLALLASIIIIFVFFWVLDLNYFLNVVENPTLKRIRLHSEDKIEWKVPNGIWNERKNQAEISLLIDKIPSFEGEKLERKDRPLRLKIEAYSINKHGEQIDKLVKNDYYTTNEPFGDEVVKLWSRWGWEEFEYGLAAINTNPNDEIIVKLYITNPDIMLDRGNPRLKVSGQYDSAATPWVAVFFYIGNTILVITNCFFIIFVYFIWRNYRKRNITI